MNHQDIAKLMIIVMCLLALISLWLVCRPVWTVRFKGDAESVQIRAYTGWGMRKQAKAMIRRDPRLGTFKVRRGGYQ